MIVSGSGQTQTGTVTTTTTTIKATTASPTVRRSVLPAKPPVPPKPAWELFALDPKKTLLLDFTDANPDMIFSLFSKASGITIVKDPSFKTPLTLNSAKSVNLDDAFDILNTELDFSGYELEKKGKLMVVTKKPPPQQPAPQIVAAPPPEKPVVTVYHLKYTNATQVARVINEVFTQQQLESLVKQLQGGGGFPGGGQPQFGQPQGASQPKTVRASGEEYSNSVVVTALPENQTQVAELIKQLDQATDLPLESKIFKLEHVSVDQVVEAVQNVLSANAPTGRGASSKQDQNQNFYGYYNPFSNRSNSTTGSQSAVAVKQSNSLVVSASHANIEVVGNLLKSLDVESPFVGTTAVIQLKNAKASDLAPLLQTAFTKRKDQSQDNPFFFFFDSDQSNGNNKKNDSVIDQAEDGTFVNVRDLTGKVNIMAEPNTNSLIVVTLPSNLKLVRDVVNQLDKIGDQVMIETIIVEANLDRLTKLGVEFNLLENRPFSTSGASATSTSTFGVQNSTTPNTGYIYSLTAKNYNIFLNAVENDTRFKVLDTPRVFTSNNVKADIEVTTQLPYTTSQQTGVIGGLVSNYDYKNVGVVLTVTPRIASSGQVAMDIVQSADDLQGYLNNQAPIINHRQATTSATVLDGETVVLGGIIQHKTNTVENKIPILGDLPLFGPLFRSTSHEKTQTELLVLLTPHIVRNDDDAQRIRRQEEKQLSPGSQGDLKKTIESQRSELKKTP